MFERRRGIRTHLTALLVALALPSHTLAQAPPEAAPPDPPPTIELPAELQRVLTDYEQAWQARDAEALAALFTADGFVLSPGHPPVRGGAAIRAHYAGRGGPLSLRPMAYATEGSVGYVIGGYSPAPSLPDGGKFTLTLRRGEDGRWLIASDMDNGNR